MITLISGNFVSNTLSSGQDDELTSGSDQFAVLAGGELFVDSGASVSSATVFAGGLLFLSAGATGSYDVVSGGSETVYGTETGATLVGGGFTVEGGGSVSGSAGGYDEISDGGGGGGVSETGGTFANSGSVTGGAGGFGAFTGGGGGGVGVRETGGIFANTGSVIGGAGGNGAFEGSGGGGGAGVSETSGTFANSDSVTGGAGGYGFEGGGGGAGVSESGGAFTNSGSVAGGAGGGAYDQGGGGGAGVSETGGTFVNSGSVIGGGGSGDPTFGGAGGAGVFLDGGTFTNAGSVAGGAGGSGQYVSGSAGDAVQFGGDAPATLVVDPGASFSGLVAADAAVDDVLELASGSAANLSGLGSQFTGFTTLNVDSGANWTLSSETSGGALNTFVYGTLSGATVYSGQTLTVEAGGQVYDTTVLSGGQLTISSGGGGFNDAVASGGVEYVGGTETSASVGAGGELVVQSGGVLAGATLSGGLIDVTNNGAATGVIGFGSGADELEVSSLFYPTFGALLSGVKVGDTIDTAVPYSPTVSLVYAGGVLTVSDGGPSETFHVASATAAGFFASNDGHGDTLLTGVADTPPTITPQTPAVVEQGQSTVIAAVQTGAAGAALQLENVSAADGTLSLVSTGSGSDNVVYTANASVPSSVLDSVTYTVADTLAFSSNGSASVQLDAGPTLSQNAPAKVGHGQTVEIATVAPGLAGDTLTLNQTNGAGTLTISSGGVYYTAPSVVSVGQVDILAYTISDQHNDATVSGGASIALDTGPAVTNGALTIAGGETEDITPLLYSFIEPGLAGDGETLIAVSATAGTVTLSGGSATYTAPSGGTATITYTFTDQLGDIASAQVAVTVDSGPTLTNKAPTYVAAGVATTVGTATAGFAGEALTLVTLTAPSHGSLTLTNGNVVYLSSGTVPAGGESDSFKYEIKDQYGDLSSVVSASVTVDPGPTAKAGAITVGHSKSGLNETAYIATLFSAGVSGDGTAVASVTGAKLAGGQVTYTPPASGSANFSYTVTDSLGQSASNTVTVTVDPGPKAGNVTASVNLGQSLNLTNAILAAAAAGLKGDTLTITADNTTGTAGAVSLVNGQLVYSASGAGLAHIPANASLSDSFAFTISDAYGDTSTGTAKITVSDPADVINGSPYGNSTIQGTSGADVINAYDWYNTIYDNGGNDIVNAGAGNATVYASTGDVVVNLNGYYNTVSGGNGADTVSGSQGNTTVTLGGGDDKVSTGGYYNTITLGNGADSVSAGLGNAVVSLGNGNDTVNAGGFSNAITVGSGTDTIIAGAGLDQVTAGAGVETITLAGFSDTVTLNGGTATVSAGQGLETVIANGGHDTLSFAGTGDLAKFSGAVSASLADAGLGLRIDVSSSAATLTLTGFGTTDSIGVIDLLGGAGGYKSAAAVLGALHSDGHGGTSLSLGASGSIDFVNTALSALHSSNFLIG